MAEFDQIDLIIIHLPIDTWGHTNKSFAVEAYIGTLLNMKSSIPKPVALILHSRTSSEALQIASKKRAKLLEAGFPVFYSFPSAAKAINKFIGCGIKSKNVNSHC